MSGICALVSLIELGSIPFVALPVNSVCRKILIETLPPNGVVIKVKRNICEDCIFLC